MRKPDYGKLKKLAVASFCVLAVAGNIVQYVGNNKNEEIIFYEAPTVSEQTVAEINVESADETNQASTVTEEETASVSANSSLININTAGSSELQALSGIGPSKAQAIIDYRNSYGSFVSIEEIMEVKGIGEGTFSKIKDLITI